MDGEMKDNYCFPFPPNDYKAQIVDGFHELEDLVKSLCRRIFAIELTAMFKQVSDFHKNPRFSRIKTDDYPILN